MLFSSAFHLRTGITAALLTAALITTSSAQTPSRALASLQPVAQADRIAAHPDFTPLTQLDHQLPGWVATASQSSARSIDLSTTIHSTLILRRSDAAQTAFEQLLANQQNPSSPLYHQWLTPQQVGQLFGPTPNDLAKLNSWLTSQGLKVDHVSPSGVLVSVSGTAAILGNAFHTTFAIFDLASATGNDAATGTRLSAVAEPSIPSALTPLVRSIQGLAEVSLHPMSHATAFKRPTTAPGVRPQYTNTYQGSTSYFIMPDDFAVIYDIASVYSGGNTGAKIGATTQRIAVIGVSAVDNTDVTDYETIAGLSTSDLPTVVVPPGSTSPGITGNSSQDEATLDVDRVIGTAPGAAVDLMIAADTATSSGLFTAAQYNVDTKLDPVMTISFGGCEVDNGLANTDYVDNLASAGAMEGITTLVSSGDSGAAGCETSFKPVTGTQVASINFICSSSYVTCVGGTEFNDTTNPTAYWSATNSTPGYESALGYIPEGGWNEPSSVNASNVTTYAPAASGGGVSTFIAKPTWQTGTGVPSGSFRFVPDVAFSASAHDGYFACLAYAGGDCEKNYFEDFSGTSAAAPGMAGIVALINTATGAASGNINPTLYAQATSTPTAFHDATIASSGVTNCTTATPSMCNNSTPGPTGLTGGLAGFELTTGYDEVTGLGSIDVAKLISSVSGGGGGTPSFTLAANPTTLSATPTASSTTTEITGTATSQITLTSTNSFAGTVALSCAVTPVTVTPPTCALSPASAALTANGTATSTLTITYFGSSLGGCDPPVASNTVPWQPVSGVVVAGLLLLVLPLRKRRSIRALAIAFLFTAGIASLSGCGGGSQTTHNCTPPTIPGTTAGTYTVTITGTSGTTTATTTVALTIN